MNAPDSFVAHFREAAPYIRQMRGTTLVAGIDGRLLEGGTLNKLAADIGLLSQLGIRLVLIHGAYHFLDRLAAAQGRTPHYCRGLRVTDETSLGQAQQFAGTVRSRFEAALCGSVSGFARAPSVPLVSGNFLTARPIGVIDGTDMEYAGVIRKTDTAALRFQLDAGNIVWMPPLGHSYGGKTFNLDMVQAAASVAVSLQAEKLVYLTLSDGISRPDGTLAETLSAQEAQSLAEHAASETRRLISSAVAALEGGVHRVQILNGPPTAACCKNSSPATASARPLPKKPSSPSGRRTAATSRTSPPSSARWKNRASYCTAAANTSKTTFPNFPSSNTTATCTAVPHSKPLPKPIAAKSPALPSRRRHRTAVTANACLPTLSIRRAA